VSRPGAAGRRGLLIGSLSAGTALPVQAQHAPSPGPSSSGFAGYVARANANVVGIVSGGVDGTYIRIAADLSAVLDDSDRLRVLPIVGKGSLQNIADIMFLRGVDIGIVQSDALTYAKRGQLYPGVETVVQYIAKLYDEEVHLLAGSGVERIEDLAGKPVNLDVNGSGTAMTASVLFGVLGIEIEPRHDPQDLALEKLKRGEIAAMVYVAGKPARLFSGLPPASGLRFLPIALSNSLVETYLPATLTHVEYPALIAPEAAVETVAVGAVLAVYGWPAGNDRFRKLQRFVESLNAKFDQLRQPPRHPKWRDVSLVARVPGWTRFAPAEAAAAARR
jgi:uncharacterized protein